MTRVISGAVLGAAALAAILFLPVLGLRVLACVLAVVAAHEYLQVVHRGGRVAGRGPLFALVAATCWSISGRGGDTLLYVLLLGAGWVAIEVLVRWLSVETAAGCVFAAWYIGLPLGMLAAVHAQGGSRATLLLIATVVVSDSAQYYSGRMFGRRPLAPAISPKKTIEGAIGGVVLGTAFVLFAGGWALGETSPVLLASLGVAMVALGIAGDLFESRLKRTAGVKDSSGLIPGHGGVLDRIDALLFATPAFFLFLQSRA